MANTQSEKSVFLKKLTEIIEGNLKNEQFGVSELARALNMSRSNLHRRVKVVDGTSVSQFIRKVRLTKAMELLQQTSLTISEVAFECGFHSVSYFTKCFHNHFGYPPGRVEKNEADELNSDSLQHHDTKPIVTKKQQRLIILGSALFVIITVFVLFFIFRPFADRNKLHDKSIAVLPFINDSPKETEMYFINGTMEAILDNLSKIEDLRVVSRTSVEQYRNNLKSIPEIGKEMGVSFILEGSGLKQGDNIRLTVQLIEAIKDRQIWSQTYEKKTGEVLELYSDIPQLVASKIEATVTPEEKKLIEKTPTTSLTAYDFYQRGREEYWKYWSVGDLVACEKAEDLYYKALKYDSTFAQVYSGLAIIYWYKHFSEEYFSESFMDSVLILTNIALTYDDQLPEAYNVRGLYYQEKGRLHQAIKEFNKALEFNPNDWFAYYCKGWMYVNVEDLVNVIDNFNKVASLNLQSGLKIGFLVTLCWSYTLAGFPEKEKYYAQEAFKLSDDTAQYYHLQGWIEYYLGNFETAIKLFEKANVLFEKANPIDSYYYAKNFEFLGECCLMYGQYEESLKYFKKWIEVVGDPVRANVVKAFWIGYDYWINGYKEEAEYYFNEIFNFWNRLNESGKGEMEQNLRLYYLLSGIYAIKGEKDKAIDNLKIFNQKQKVSLMWLFYVKNDPSFDSIRDEPEFQQIVKEIEVKYEAEHERVRKWLENHEML